MKAKDVKVGVKFLMEEETSPGLTENLEHEVVQAYQKRRFNGPVMVIKTDRGADLALPVDHEIEVL